MNFGLHVVVLIRFLVDVHTNSADDKADIVFWNNIARRNIEVKIQSNQILLNGRRPKNVIFFLGDGMGITAVTGGRIYRNQKNYESYTQKPLNLEKLAHTGIVKTHSFNYHVTDSAAGAMALFGGRKVDSNTLGMLPRTGEQCPRSGATDINDGVAEQALKKGLSVGFVTTTRITHATPGAMYAKGIVRWFEHDGNIPNGTDCAKDIASQLVQYPASEFKVMMGGGRNYLLDRSLGGNRTDGRNIEKEWAAIAGKRTVLTDVAQLDRFEAENNEKVLGVFSGSHLPYHLDEVVSNQRTVPRLVEMTEKAIESMEKDNNNGYFLMIEGGMIDQAEHENQMHLAFEELLEFDEAIKKARQLTDDSETLIIVTADHSHAMSLPGYLQVNQSIFESSFSWGQQDNLPIPGIYFTSGPGYGGEKRRNYTKEEATHPHFAQPAGIPMVKGVHGGDDVGIWSEGPFAWLFTGTIENTEVAYYIKFLLCLDRNEKNMCDLQNERENLYEKSSKRTSDQEGVMNDIIDQIGSRNLLIISLILSFVVCILMITTLFLALILCMLNKRNLYSPDSETTLVK